MDSEHESFTNFSERVKKYSAWNRNLFLLQKPDEHCFRWKPVDLRWRKQPHRRDFWIVHKTFLRNFRPLRFFAVVTVASKPVSRCFTENTFDFTCDSCLPSITHHVYSSRAQIFREARFEDFHVKDKTPAKQFAKIWNFMLRRRDNLPGISEPTFKQFSGANFLLFVGKRP